MSCGEQKQSPVSNQCGQVSVCGFLFFFQATACDKAVLFRQRLWTKNATIHTFKTGRAWPSLKLHHDIRYSLSDNNRCLPSSCFSSDVLTHICMLYIYVFSVRGTDPSLCLDAFAVALLHGTYDGNQWYASTKNVQLASLRFCGLCRRGAPSTLHLRVDGGTPRRLWAGDSAAAAAVDADAAVTSSGGGAVVVVPDTTTEGRRPPGEEETGEVVDSRVPRIRGVRGVTWELPAAMLGSASRESFANLGSLRFGDDFNESLDGVVWPRGLRRLVLGEGFDQPVDGVRWPPSLTEVTFSVSFNQPISAVAWPPSLQQLTFGLLFDQPIDRVALPPSLRRLIFEGSFNQPIQGVSWPPRLEELTFKFCRSRSRCVVSAFNQPLQGVEWPESLKELTFGRCFNQPVEGVRWPRALMRLRFGGKFNQPIQGVAWPPSLQEVAFSASFCQPVAGIRWPSSLKRLTFGPPGAVARRGLGLGS